MYQALGLDGRYRAAADPAAPVCDRVQHGRSGGLHFYGALAVSTGYDFSRFDLHPYYKGFRMALPQRTDPDEARGAGPAGQDVRGVQRVHALGRRDRRGEHRLAGTRGFSRGAERDLIRIAEALHEEGAGQSGPPDLRETSGRRSAHRADFGAPSACPARKTTFCAASSASSSAFWASRSGARLARRLISWTGRRRLLDEDGEYDYEALEAIDVGRFNDDLAALLAGREVGMPRYNFITGKSEPNHRRLRMDERSVLLIEGIHAESEADAANRRGDEVQGLRLGPDLDRNGRPDGSPRPTTG